MISMHLVMIALGATVANTNDLGPGSLRQALIDTIGNETIEFDPAVFPAATVTWIEVDSALPPVDEMLVTLAGDGRVGIRPRVPLSLPNAHGLVVTGDLSSLDGLAVAGFGRSGIAVVGAFNARLLGNEITDVGGDGITVSGDDLTFKTLVSENLVRRACASPLPGTSCAGIAVRPAGGSAPEMTIISVNTVVGTAGTNAQTHGVGILVAGGMGALVTDNLLGTPDGATAEGNFGHGILLAAPQQALVEDTEIRGNVVVASGRNGITLGMRSLDSLVVENFVGVGSDGATPIANTGVGIQVFESTGHVIGSLEEGNVVSGNGHHGIELTGLTAPAAPVIGDLDVGWNIIGLDAVGGLAVGNGLTGIRVAQTLGQWSIHDNTISANSGAGIVANGDSVWDTCHISWNRIGTDVTGTLAFGNLGDGVDLRGSDCTVDHNTVSSNGGNGIILRGDRQHVTDNRIGVAQPPEFPGTDSETDLGNGADGIRVTEGNEITLLGNLVQFNGGDGIDATPAANLGGIATLALGGNAIAHNGSAGVRNDQAQLVPEYTATRNSVWDNGTCAYALDYNGALPVVEAPIVTYWDQTTVTGTWTAAGAGESIEVFYDEGTEARRYLGRASFVALGGVWYLYLPAGQPLIPAGVGRVSAIYTADGTSSALEEYCGDGCAVGGSCEDDNDCTVGVCVGSGQCTQLALPDGTSCDDGNECTTSSTCSAGACSVGGGFSSVGTQCDDADACTSGTTCDSMGQCVPWTCDLVGQCVAAVVHDCDDDPIAPGACYAFANERDVFPDPFMPGGRRPTCDPVEGCGEPVRRPVGALCQDGDLCATGDTCDAGGTCQAGPAVVSCPETGCNTCSCDPYEGCSCTAIDEVPPAQVFCSVDDWAQGTDDCSDDDDNNGFPDDWEDAGLDGDCDGDLTGSEDYPPEFFNTPFATIHVEIDWMADSDHSHDPEATLVSMQETYLAYGPYTLDIDYSDALPHHDLILLNATKNPAILDDDDYVWRSDVKASNFGAERRGIYHYAVLAHDLDVRNPGVGEIGGDDLTIGVTNLLSQAGILFHELGHNLGLTHGGDEGDGGLDNDEPNYQSSMNYFYPELVPVTDTGGPDADGVEDYSHEELNTLEEDALIEGHPLVNYYPLGGDIVVPRYWFEWVCPDVTPCMADPMARWVDFDCDGVPDLAPVQVDLNGDGTSDDTLTGAQDWGSSRIALDFQRDDDFVADYVDPSAHSPVADPIGRGLLGTRRPRLAVQPGCAESIELPTSAGRRATVIVYGSLRLDVTRIDVERTRLGGAVPVANFVRDVDSDGYADLVTEHRAEDMTLSSDAEVAHFGGYTTDGLRVARTVPAAYALDDPDADGDGIHDACDACPAQGGSTRGPDGCPW